MAEIWETFARQILGYGYFAEVCVEAEWNTTSEGLTVVFDDKYAVDYRGAAQFGAEYAWEQYPSDKKGHRGLKVNVKAIVWQPVDTSSVLVAYVTTIAVWRSLNWKPIQGPVFDDKLRAIVFPKRVKRV